MLNILLNFEMEDIKHKNNYFMKKKLKGYTYCKTISFKRVNNILKVNLTYQYKTFNRQNVSNTIIKIIVQKVLKLHNCNQKFTDS